MERKPNGKNSNIGGGGATGPNPHLRQHILDVVDNQLRDNTPPAAREAYERLQAGGYTPIQAKEMIAVLVIECIYDILKTDTPYNEAEYEKRLRALR